MFKFFEKFIFQLSIPIKIHHKIKQTILTTFEKTALKSFIIFFFRQHSQTFKPEQISKGNQMLYNPKH